MNANEENAGPYLAKLDEIQSVLAEIAGGIQSMSKSADPGPQSEYLTIKDAQRLLGNISRASVYRLLDEGELDSVRIRGRRLIPRSSVQAMLIRSNVPASSRP